METKEESATRAVEIEWWSFVEGEIFFKGLSPGDFE